MRSSFQGSHIVKRNLSGGDRSSRIKLLTTGSVQCVGTRWRLDNVHNKFFTSNELEDIGWTDKEIWKLHYRPWRRKLAYWCRGLEFTVPLIAVLFVGAVLVSLAL